MTFDLVVGEICVTDLKDALFSGVAQFGSTQRGPFTFACESSWQDLQECSIWYLYSTVRVDEVSARGSDLLVHWEG